MAPFPPPAAPGYARAVDNFSWVLKDQVAAMAAPPPDAGPMLRERGFTAVVSLTRRPALKDPPEGLRVLHLPVPDMTAPRVAQLAQAVLFIEDALSEGGRALVHCLAGQGRTGTVLAALFVARGADPAEAIARIRDLRPGSVETVEQEHAVHRFAEAWREEEGRARGRGSGGAR